MSGQNIGANQCGLIPLPKKWINFILIGSLGHFDQLKNALDTVD